MLRLAVRWGPSGSLEDGQAAPNWGGFETWGRETAAEEGMGVDRVDRSEQCDDM